MSQGTEIEAERNRTFHLTQPVVFILLAFALGMTSCQPATPPAPTPSPERADLTARRTMVQRHRGDNAVPVDVDDHVPVETGDQVQVDETGRGLLRFQDRLLVELFRDTGVLVTDVKLEPGDLLSVRLKQSYGHTRTELESIANARVTVETDYATIRALGTEFLVCHDQSLTCMVTLKGETEVEAQGQVVVVPAGQGTYVLPGEPPKPPIPAHLDDVDDWLAAKRGTEEIGPLGALVISWAERASSASPSNSPAAPAPALPSKEEMVRIEPGVYQIGGPQPDDFHISPQEIELDEFWIDQYEVTNAQYQAFVVETNQPPPANWPGGQIPPGQDNHPVTEITWDAAAAYCAWANKRLPTEAEWEVAARGPGPQPTLYPWGPDPLAGGQIDALPRAETYEVGTKSFNQSPFGVYDMAGNVWEWVGEPYGPVPEGQKILRGGRHSLITDMAYRQPAAPDDERFLRAVGFRCATNEAQGE